ncbi:hypothetical protein OG802_09770 [Streptomyces sp. NBC_00704]|uniref:hypothetical protein n=1 Tax=Streptomyces sp. NBC_00704 TaxID=2975809 RepID=UPI002E34B307|nr:hypothetical protein [Streptomyces sp. NBC_00704]
MPLLLTSRVRPDTAMSVRLTSPIEASVVAVDLLRLSASRFGTGTPHGNIGLRQPALVDDALRAVLTSEPGRGRRRPQRREAPSPLV